MKEVAIRIVEGLVILAIVWLFVATPGCNTLTEAGHGFGKDLKKGGAYIEKVIQPQP